MPRFQKSVQAMSNGPRVPVGAREETTQDEFIKGTVIHRIHKAEDGQWYLNCHSKTKALYGYKGYRSVVTCSKCRSHVAIADENGTYRAAESA